MPDETQTTSTPKVADTTDVAQVSQNDGSKIGSLSVRGLIAIFLVLTICILAFMTKVIPDVLANLTVSVISFYFGHQMGQNKK
jgi:hypothetical protein